MIEAHEADHWTAFRARRGEPLELWYRRDYVPPALDMRLNADFERYLDTLLAARGVTGWPLLLVDPKKLDAKARAGIKRWGIPLSWIGAQS